MRMNVRRPWRALGAALCATAMWGATCDPVVLTSNDELSVLGNGGQVDFGSVPVGSSKSQYYGIGNESGRLVTLTGSALVELSESGAVMFSVATPPAKTVDANGLDPFLLTFRPTAAGSYSVTVSIAYDGTQSPLSFTVTGQGVAQTADGPAVFGSTVIDSGMSGDVKAMADFNGDGQIDVAEGGATLVWYAYPNWTKRTIATANSEFTTDMQAADVNRDGRMDLRRGRRLQRPESGVVRKPKRRLQLGSSRDRRHRQLGA